MIKTAYIVGNGEHIESDVLLASDVAAPYSVYALDESISTYPGHVDYAVTMRADKADDWFGPRSKQELQGPGPQLILPDGCAGAHWTAPNLGGGSALLAVMLAMYQRHGKIILIGCDIAEHEQPAWHKHRKTMRPFVRSFSGYAFEKFGPPTENWMESRPRSMQRPDWWN